MSHEVPNIEQRYRTALEDIAAHPHYASNNPRVFSSLLKRYTLILKTAEDALGGSEYRRHKRLEAHDVLVARGEAEPL